MSPETERFGIILGPGADLGPVWALREAVFIREQAVPAELERDEWDARAWHALFSDDRGPLATGRLFLGPEGWTIGRVAVRADQRGRGWGQRVMEALEAQARDLGVPEISLHAQVQARDFYRRLGWQARGEEFVEAGILHQTFTKAP